MIVFLLFPPTKQAFRSAQITVDIVTLREDGEPGGCVDPACLSAWFCCCCCHRQNKPSLRLVMTAARFKEFLPLKVLSMPLSCDQFCETLCLSSQQVAQVLYVSTHLFAVSTQLSLPLCPVISVSTQYSLSCCL